MKSESMADKRIFNNLQALRGFAALLVCCYHYQILIDHPWSKVAFGNGWLGVQIFFIISGFIMVHTTAGIKTDLISGARRFFVNRIFRIVPLYYLCTFLFIADNIDSGFWERSGSQLIHSLLFISPMTEMKGPFYGPPLLEVGWTLNYEMLFYFIFAISILFGARKFQFLYSYFIAVVFLVPILLVGSVSNSYETYHNYPFSYLNILSNPVLAHFLLGITMALVVPHFKMKRIWCRILLPLSFIVFILYITGYLGLNVNLWNDLIFCGFLVFAVLINDYSSQGFQFPKLFVRFGDMSYSFYLLHPIILGYRILLLKNFNFLNSLGGPGLFILIICLTSIASWILYQTLELRLTRYLRLKFNK